MAVSLGYSFKRGYYQYFFQTDDEVKFNDYLLAGVRGEYLAHPLLAARCTALNLFNFWFAGRNWLATGLNVVVQLPLITLAMIGLRVAARERGSHAVAPSLLPVLYLFAVHAPVLAQARYSVPLIPFLAVFACIGLVRLPKPRLASQ